MKTCNKKGMFEVNLSIFIVCFMLITIVVIPIFSNTNSPLFNKINREKVNKEEEINIEITSNSQKTNDNNIVLPIRI
jgi:ATP/ADP translocase